VIPTKIRLKCSALLVFEFTAGSREKFVRAFPRRMVYAGSPHQTLPAAHDVQERGVTHATCSLKSCGDFKN
jgi:hypothetical protein